MSVLQLYILVNLIHLDSAEPFERIPFCSIAGILCSFSAHGKCFEDICFGTCRLNFPHSSRISAFFISVMVLMIFGELSWVTSAHARYQIPLLVR